MTKAEVDGYVIATMKGLRTELGKQYDFLLILVDHNAPGPDDMLLVSRKAAKPRLQDAIDELAERGIDDITLSPELKQIERSLKDKAPTT